MHLHESAGWRWRADGWSQDLVACRAKVNERTHVGDKCRELHDLREVGAYRRERAGDVREGLPTLREKISITDKHPLSIERNLPGDIHGSAGTCDQAWYELRTRGPASQ